MLCKTGHTFVFNPATIQITGKQLSSLKQEIGIHRIQRVPPTEKRGRVHTSSVTVVVYQPTTVQEITIEDRDLKVEWFSGTGKGGQKRNKVQSCCRLTHIPTGIVKASQQRSRQSSFDCAKRDIEIALTQRNNQRCMLDNKLHKQTQPDNIRLYNYKNNTVTDLRSNVSVTIRSVLKEGKFSKMWLDA